MTDIDVNQITGRLARKIGDLEIQLAVSGATNEALAVELEAARTEIARLIDSPAPAKKATSANRNR